MNLWMSPSPPSRVLTPKTAIQGRHNHGRACAIIGMKSQTACLMQGHLPKGTKGVRLELDLDPQEILLSDFADWHFPLNDFFLPLDETESEQFDREEREAGYDCRGPRPEPLQSRVLTSWERIFDFTRECRDWRGRFRARDIQATFWELRMEHVRDVTFYTDRGR